MFGDIMKNVIYSFYKEIKDNDIRDNSYFSGDTLSKSEKTKLQFIKYKDKLINSKKDYAKICNADFILFDDVEKIYDNDEFDSVNFYKHYLMEKLLKDYDNILYLDFDVVPNTNESFFDVHDMNKINVHAINATKHKSWSYEALNSKHDYEFVMRVHFDKYHMYCKALCKQSMLIIDDIYNNDFHIANTGIIGGSAESLSQIKMTERYDEILNRLNTAKEEKYFGENVTRHFFANNEVFFSYILDRFKPEWNNLSSDWHYCHYKVSDEDKLHDIYNKIKVRKAKLIHVIDKNFDLIYNV